jgi:hypothetical protein
MTEVQVTMPTILIRLRICRTLEVSLHEVLLEIERGERREGGRATRCDPS